jgi:hypothetical protein
MREWRSRNEIYVNRRSNLQNLRTDCPTGRDGASAVTRLQDEKWKSIGLRATRRVVFSRGSKAMRPFRLPLAPNSWGMDPPI